MKTDDIAVLLNQLITVEDISQLNTRISTCIEHLFDARKKPSIIVASFFSHTETEALSKWTGLAFETAKPSEIQNALEKLKKLIIELPVLEMTVAYTPSEKMERTILSWAQENLGSSVVLRFKNNPALIGGAIISFQGKMHDYSLQKKINELLPV